jgi:hypothetical protein
LQTLSLDKLELQIIHVVAQAFNGPLKIEKTRGDNVRIWC